MLSNNEWVNNKIKKESKKYLETNGNEHTTTQTLWDTTKAVQEVQSSTGLLKEDRKFSNKSRTFYLQDENNFAFCFLRMMTIEI